MAPNLLLVLLGLLVTTGGAVVGYSRTQQGFFALRAVRRQLRRGGDRLRPPPSPRELV